MSASRASTLLQVPTIGQLQTNSISLLDRSTSGQSTPLETPHLAERSDSERGPARSDSEYARLYQRLTDNSLSLSDNVRREIVRQRYAKFGQDRYDACTTPVDNDIESPGDMPIAGMSKDAQLHYFARAQDKAKAYWKRKRTLGQGTDKRDTVVDVLYENQRGAFMFGIPKYSSNSLLPTDPKPWQNTQFRTSAVDIRNAQVPDPSWEWVWKSWYVDMSRDVDEEGWEYSFAFVGRGSTTFAWHGNHPWFHSFVRRRRWLRMRRRRDLSIHHTKVKAHEMAADYFTIHAKTIRAESFFSGQPRTATLNTRASATRDTVPAISEMDISTIGDLFLALRSASVDREKLLAVRKFVEAGGDELLYLEKHIAEVMSMFMFQSSRRLLLKALQDRYETAQQELGDSEISTEDQGSGTTQDRKQKAQRSQRLHDVVQAADKQVGLLEFWSDVKSAHQSFSTHSHVKPSMESKQDAEAGLPDLHKHPEHDKPDTRAKSANRKSNRLLDPPSIRHDSSEGGKLERFVTAPESPSEIKKGKAKAKAKVKSTDNASQ